MAVAEMAATMSLPLIYARHGAIAEVVINRPASRNALTPEMLCRFADAVIDFSSNTDLRVMILRAEGDKAFCAGGDLALSIPLLTGAREPADEWDQRLLEDVQVLQASSLRDFPLHKPVVAAINGACFAAGFEIMLGTDIRIAASHAAFCLPEVKRGIIPFAGSMVRLPHQVPYCKAMEIMLVGEPISADEALRIGLVNEVLPAAEVLPRAWQLAEKIARNAPVAVQQVKRTVMEASGRPFKQGFALEDEARRTVLASDDAQEGPRAFVEKREPRFTGH